MFTQFRQNINSIITLLLVEIVLMLVEILTIKMTVPSYDSTSKALWKTIPVWTIKCIYFWDVVDLFYF